MRTAKPPSSTKKRRLDDREGGPSGPPSFSYSRVTPQIVRAARPCWTGKGRTFRPSSNRHGSLGLPCRLRAKDSEGAASRLGQGHDRPSSIALCCDLRARCANRVLHRLRSHRRRDRRMGRSDCRTAARDTCLVAGADGATYRWSAGHAVIVTPLSSWSGSSTATSNHRY